MKPRDHEIDADDVVRFLEVASEFDVEAVKFTGGEPMLRQDPPFGTEQSAKIRGAMSLRRRTRREGVRRRRNGSVK